MRSQVESWRSSLLTSLEARSRLVGGKQAVIQDLKWGENYPEVPQNIKKYLKVPISTLKYLEVSQSWKTTKKEFYPIVSRLNRFKPKIWRDKDICFLE